MGGQQRPYKYVGAPFRAPAFRMAAPAGLQRRTHRHLLRCGRLGAPCWCSAQQARGRSRAAQQQPASFRRSSSAAAPKGLEAAESLPPPPAGPTPPTRPPRWARAAAPHCGGQLGCGAVSGRGAAHRPAAGGHPGGPPPGRPASPAQAWAF